MTGQVQLFKNKLGECKKLETSDCLHKTSFEITNLPIFYIFENREGNSPVKMVTGKPYQLTVINKKNQDICLIKTDRCLFTDENQKCDCILFNKTTLFFVEISESKGKKRRGKRADAYLQIEATYNSLKNNLIDLSKFQLNGRICFMHEGMAVTRASENAKKAYFNDILKIYVTEGNGIDF